MYHLSADRQQSSELLQYMAFNGGVKSQLFSSQSCMKCVQGTKKCSLPLHRAQGEDCEDVLNLYVYRPGFRPILFEMCHTEFPGLLVDTVL